MWRPCLTLCAIISRALSIASAWGLRQVGKFTSFRIFNAFITTEDVEEIPWHGVTTTWNVRKRTVLTTVEPSLGSHHRSPIDQGANG
jgi:hypothetical protein